MAHILVQIGICICYILSLRLCANHNSALTDGLLLFHCLVHSVCGESNVIGEIVTMVITQNGLRNLLCEVS